MRPGSSGQEERGTALGPIGVQSAFFSTSSPTGALEGVRPTPRSHLGRHPFVEIPKGTAVGLGKESREQLSQGLGVLMP